MSRIMKETDAAAATGLSTLNPETKTVSLIAPPPLLVLHSTKTSTTTRDGSLKLAARMRTHGGGDGDGDGGLKDNGESIVPILIPSDPDRSSSSSLLSSSSNDNSEKEEEEQQEDREDLFVVVGAVPNASDASGAAAAAAAAAAPSSSSSPSVSKACTMEKKTKAVRFDKIYVYKHEITLGCNPAVSSGPPLEIQWRAFATMEYDVDIFEDMRSKFMPRRTGRPLCLRIEEDERRFLILRASGGVTVADMDFVQSEIELIQDSRDQVEREWMQELRLAKIQQQHEEATKAALALVRAQEAQAQKQSQKHTIQAATMRTATKSTTKTSQELPDTSLFQQGSISRKPATTTTMMTTLEEDADAVASPTRRWKKPFIISGWRKKQQQQSELNHDRHQAFHEKNVTALKKKSQEPPAGRELWYGIGP